MFFCSDVRHAALGPESLTEHSVVPAPQLRTEELSPQLSLLPSDQKPANRRSGFSRQKRSDPGPHPFQQSLTLKISGQPANSDGTCAGKCLALARGLNGDSHGIPVAQRDSHETVDRTLFQRENSLAPGALHAKKAFSVSGKHRAFVACAPGTSEITGKLEERMETASPTADSSSRTIRPESC